MVMYKFKVRLCSPVAAISPCSFKIFFGINNDPQTFRVPLGSYRFGFPRIAPSTHAQWFKFRLQFNWLFRGWSMNPPLDRDYRLLFVLSDDLAYNSIENESVYTIHHFLVQVTKVLVCESTIWKALGRENWPLSYCTIWVSFLSTNTVAMCTRKTSFGILGMLY